MSNTTSGPSLQENPTYVYVSAFVDELQRTGTQNVVICPGSRSTPLALVIASHPTIHTWMHVDERSAAFFALGMAKSLRQPVALVCTSGTAAANFLPAIIEAHLTHVPLLVLTADRPHELRDCGAPQAIDQNRIYGTYTRWFVDVALPEASNAALRYIRTLACRAVGQSLALPAGPVHLNFPFREPLTPNPLADQPLPPETQRDPLAWQGRPNNAPYVEIHDAPLASTSTASLANLAEQLGSSPRGLIVVGTLDLPALAEPLIQLARLLGYPILADPLSQLRSNIPANSPIIASYDAFLRLNTVIERAEPQVILRFGTMPTSKPLLLYIKRYATCPQIVVDDHGGWEEPTQLASTMIHADPVSLCQDLLAAFKQEQPIVDQMWLTFWQDVEKTTRHTLQSAIQDFQPLFEGRIFTELAQILPAGTALFAGNSMPIRDADTFLWESEQPVRLFGNRGASGIDGVVSSALGVSAAAGKGEATVLVIGDLSFFHDLNGLLAARLHQLDLVVVLVNNDGGGIFSFLPQAEHPEHFEQLWGTPTGLDFAPVVQMYGGTFQRITTWEAFRTIMRDACASGGLHVIEVPTERTSNVSMHRQLWRAVDQALHEQLQRT